MGKTRQFTGFQLPWLSGRSYQISLLRSGNPTRGRNCGKNPFFAFYADSGFARLSVSIRASSGQISERIVFQWESTGLKLKHSFYTLVYIEFNETGECCPSFHHTI